MTAPMRVVLVDDHPIVLAGLRNLIQADRTIEPVGEASSGLAALALIREKTPDVAVLDISMPEINGIVLTRRLGSECPSVRVLILTIHEDRSYVRQALLAGARGYALKRSAPEKLTHAIRAVFVGGTYVDSQIAGDYVESSRKGDRKSASQATAVELTARETEVLKLTAQGFSNKEIARRIDIGVKSVETYKARGIEKVGLKSRVEIIRYGLTHGWLTDL